MRIKSFKTFDEAYRALFLPLTYIARIHLFNADYAEDAAQDAFLKTAEYLRKHKNKMVSEFILKRELMRACRRINKKFSPEISFSNEYFETL